MKDIQKVTVIGAGVMGSAIAAHLANANIPVLLLDIPHKDGRNKLAEDAIAGMKKQKPAPLMDPEFAKRISVGNIDDDLEKIQQSDWVIEAIIEKLEIKQSLYKRIDDICDGKVIVSSNTSSIPLHDLIEGRSSGFKEKFLITHFFNPPRYMRLLEIVKGNHTKSEVIEVVTKFTDTYLGKGNVFCNDTPAFIANRIGGYALMRAVDETLKSSLTIDEIDALAKQAFGFPKTGIFALHDLVGIDVLYLVGQELKDKLPEEDAFLKLDIKAVNDLYKSMIDEGYTGRKGKGGFYRLTETANGKVKQARNLKTGEFLPAQKEIKIPHFDLIKKDFHAFLMQSDESSKFAWKVLSDVLMYAASLVPVVTEDIIYVDRAMRLGFNWKLGPFEMMDNLGPSWFRNKLEEEGRKIPELLKLVGDNKFYEVKSGKRYFMDTKGLYKPIIRPEGVLRLSDIKEASDPVVKNPSVSLWNLGEGALCFEFTSKGNTIDPHTIEMIHHAIELAEKDYKTLIIHNESEHFCYGANIALFAEASRQEAWDKVQGGLEQGQRAMKKLKFSSFPVVAAPSGMALGGGCEILLHSDLIVAHAELYVGLVEVGVGIIPAWGGCKEMLLRAEENSLGGALAGFRHIFETVGYAKVSSSAYEAKKLMFMRKDDPIVMNKDRLLFEAKRRALEMVNGYTPPIEKSIKLPGKPGYMALKMALKGFQAAGKLSEYDLVIGDKLAYVLTGGDTDLLHKVSEQKLFDLEREAVMDLIKNAKTLERIEYTLNTGKPLRN